MTNRRKAIRPRLDISNVVDPAAAADGRQAAVAAALPERSVDLHDPAADADRPDLRCGQPARRRPAQHRVQHRLHVGRIRARRRRRRRLLGPRPRPQGLPQGARGRRPAYPARGRRRRRRPAGRCHQGRPVPEGQARSAGRRARIRNRSPPLPPPASIPQDRRIAGSS